MVCTIMMIKNKICLCTEGKFKMEKDSVRDKE